MTGGGVASSSRSPDLSGRPDLRLPWCTPRAASCVRSGDDKTKLSRGSPGPAGGGLPRPSWQGGCSLARTHPTCTWSRSQSTLADRQNVILFNELVIATENSSRLPYAVSGATGAISSRVSCGDFIFYICILCLYCDIYISGKPWRSQALRVQLFVSEYGCG